ncbi:MAG: hypothetical protein OXE78_07310 [Gammaproteobacteria bacterium]|nr:hypothetical protein [Gammaproteobacteria bacterium]
MSACNQTAYSDKLLRIAEKSNPLPDDDGGRANLLSEPDSVIR